MKKALLATAFAALAATLAAAQMQHQHDADKMQGGGSLPAGWSARLDNGSTTPDGVKITASGGALHFQSGPAGIYYKAADKAAGTYTVSASFTQMEPAAHPEAYGIFIGGSDLSGADQKYTYFLVRQDGKALVKRRAGASTPTILNWTENAAIKKTDAAAKGANTLTIEVGKDKVRFLANGTEVATATPDQVDANGIAGLRVNHNLNVQVEGFAVTSK
jgi:opacity protein-like surface antigen